MDDTVLQQLIDDERKRQQRGLELIPSENYVSAGVLRALGSVLTNKYSEGYPGQRYYGGQTITDQIEQLAIDRAKHLFGADHANVQPHSGAQANESMYHAWLDPGDTVMAMDLSHGGHLTHGHPVTVLAKQYTFVRYKMNDVETGSFDYDEIRRTALEYRPKILLVGHSSYPRELDYKRFAEIGHEVGALLVCDAARS
jgi:glycine hydroxymethyltransferase